MKDTRKELRKLGDAIVTSLGCIAVVIGVTILIIVVMYWTYWQPPEIDMVDVTKAKTAEKNQVLVKELNLV